jgi:hypothetical protein
MEDRTLLSTLTVMNNHDSGPGSLRATIAAAASGDTIKFASSLKGQTIALTTGELDITTSLDIDGPAPGRTRWRSAATAPATSSRSRWDRTRRSTA